MIAMNKSDFIIASTHQEIIGAEMAMGQYESYQNFTLPGLYQVLNGINLFAPKFNVIPPGVDFHILRKKSALREAPVDGKIEFFMRKQMIFTVVLMILRRNRFSPWPVLTK
jgi:hypothetical protein